MQKYNLNIFSGFQNCGLIYLPDFLLLLYNVKIKHDIPISNHLHIIPPVLRAPVASHVQDILHAHRVHIVSLEGAQVARSLHFNVI